MTPLTLEILANVLNLICVVLIYRNKASNWIFGIANSLIFIAVFIPAKLYGDAGLQVMYAILSCYGLYEWLFGNGGIKAKKQGKNTEKTITFADKDQCVLCNGLGLFLFLLFQYLLKNYTNSDVHSADALLTSISVVATIMMAHKKIQNWVYWIITNILFVPLYIHKELYLTAVCQIPLLILSVLGMKYWISEYDKSIITR